MWPSLMSRWAPRRWTCGQQLASKDVAADKVLINVTHPKLRNQGVSERTCNLLPSFIGGNETIEHRGSGTMEDICLSASHFRSTQRLP